MLGFGPKTHKVLAQGMPPVGSYGFLVSRLRAAPQPQGATVGVINFDEGGVVNGSFQNYDPGSSPPFVSGTFNGNYSSSADGTGSFTILDSSGKTTQWAMVLFEFQRANFPFADAERTFSYRVTSFVYLVHINKLASNKKKWSPTANCRYSANGRSIF
jgi:hypothetical protein